MLSFMFLIMMEFCGLFFLAERGYCHLCFPHIKKVLSFNLFLPENRIPTNYYSVC